MGTEDSAGPPHCVGPLFSGANAGSILRPRPGLYLFLFSVSFLCFLSLFLVSVTRLCFALFSYFCLSFSYSLFSHPYFSSRFCSVAPFSLYLIFSALRIPRITFHHYFLTTLKYTASHTLKRHSSPRVHAVLSISLFSVTFPCRIVETEFCTAKTF